MSLEPAELLDRIAVTVRGEIAPAIEDEYAKTQAYMAAVILQRLAKQTALDRTHAEAEAADLAALAADLEPLLSEAPAAVVEAAAELRRASGVAAIGPLIEELYAWGVTDGAGAAALAAVRRVLRRDIDRRMEIAT